MRSEVAPSPFNRGALPAPRMDAARAPPEVVRPPRLTAEVERLRSRALRLVDATIEEPRPSDERLHQLHRALRRLRLGVELWQDLLPAADRGSAAALERRTKRLARLVGEVRDRDVVIGLFDAIPRRPASPTATGRYHRFLGRLREDARTGRELLRASLRTERDAGLFDAIRAALARPSGARAAARLGRLLVAASGEHHERVRRAHRKATRRPTAERLHRLRIHLRQFRHVHELIRLVAPSAAVRIPASLRGLQGRLGHLHDLDVAIATIDPELDASPWADRLRSDRRRLRHGVRLELERLARSGGPVGTIRAPHARRST